MGLENQSELGGVMTVFENICRECKRVLRLTVTVGIGLSVDRRDNLSKSYDESKEAVGYHAVMPDLSVIYIGDVEQGSKSLIVLDKKSENELITAVKFGSREIFRLPSEQP